MFRAKTIRGCLIDRTLDPSEASSQRQHTRSRTSHQVYTSRRRTSGVGQLPTTTTEPGVDARAGTPRRHRGATTKELLTRCNAKQPLPGRSTIFGQCTDLAKELSAGRKDGVENSGSTILEDLNQSSAPIRLPASSRVTFTFQ